MDLRRLLQVSLIAGVVVTAAVVVAAMFDAGPLHAAACVLEGRDGFLIEIPEGLETPDELRRVVRSQTTCVPVEVVFVNWGLVGDGKLAEPAGAPREWVSAGATSRSGWKARPSRQQIGVGLSPLGSPHRPAAMEVLNRPSHHLDDGTARRQERGRRTTAAARQPAGTVTA